MNGGTGTSTYGGTSFRPACFEARKVHTHVQVYYM